MIEFTIALMLYGGISYNPRDEFINSLPPGYICMINSSEFQHVLNVEDETMRKRAWVRFKSHLPLDKYSDEVIKQIEEISHKTGFVIK